MSNDNNLSTVRTASADMLVIKNIFGVVYSIIYPSNRFVRFYITDIFDGFMGFLDSRWWTIEKSPSPYEKSASNESEPI